MKIFLNTLVLGALLVTLPRALSGQVRVRHREPISQNDQIDSKQQHVVEKRGIDIQSLQDQIHQLQQESPHNRDANVDDQILALHKRQDPGWILENTDWAAWTAEQNEFWDNRNGNNPAQILENTDWAAWTAEQNEFWDNRNGNTNNNGQNSNTGQSNGPNSNTGDASNINTLNGSEDETDTGVPTDIIIVISVVVPIVGLCICIPLVCIIVNCISPRRKARTIGTSQCIPLVGIIVNCISPRRKARTIGTSQYPTTVQHTDTAYPPNAGQHINTTYTPNEYMNGPTNYNTSYEPHNYNRSSEPPAEASANQDYHPRPSAPIDTGAEWEVPKPYGQPSMQPNDPPPYESLFSEKSKM